MLYYNTFSFHSFYFFVENLLCFRHYKRFFSKKKWDARGFFGKQQNLGNCTIQADSTIDNCSSWLILDWNCWWIIIYALLCLYNFFIKFFYITFLPPCFLFSFGALGIKDLKCQFSWLPQSLFCNYSHMWDRRASLSPAIDFFFELNTKALMVPCFT